MSTAYVDGDIQIVATCSSKGKIENSGWILREMGANSFATRGVE
jgi:hypothetical protein